MKKELGSEAVQFVGPSALGTWMHHTDGMASHGEPRVGVCVWWWRGGITEYLARRPH